MLFFSGRSRIERDARSQLDPSTAANEGPGDPESVEHRDLPLDLDGYPRNRRSPDENQNADAASDAP
jgi:hypothetical protein